MFLHWLHHSMLYNFWNMKISLIWVAILKYSSYFQKKSSSKSTSKANFCQNLTYLPQHLQISAQIYWTMPQLIYLSHDFDDVQFVLF